MPSIGQSINFNVVKQNLGDGSLQTKYAKGKTETIYEGEQAVSEASARNKVGPGHFEKDHETGKWKIEQGAGRELTQGHVTLAGLIGMIYNFFIPDKGTALPEDPGSNKKDLAPKVDTTDTESEHSVLVPQPEIDVEGA